MTNLPTIDKQCPSCGGRLAIRTNTKNQSQFLGCTGYPECSHTEPIPETLRLRLLGHPELPLFADDTVSPVPVVTHCRSCGARVVWGYTTKGVRAPFNVDGDDRPTQENHFISCPDRRDWRKS